MGGDEIEVRREDQDKINKFSRLHQRELLIEEELGVKNVGLYCDNTCRLLGLGRVLLTPTCRRKRRNSTISPPSSSSQTKTSLSRELCPPPDVPHAYALIPSAATRLAMPSSTCHLKRHKRCSALRARGWRRISRSWRTSWELSAKK